MHKQVTSSDEMVIRLGVQTFSSEFESHWVLYSFGLVPHPNKKLSKLLQIHTYTHSGMHTYTITHNIAY